MRFGKWRVEGDELIDPDGVTNALILPDLPSWRRARLIDHEERGERRAFAQGHEEAERDLNDRGPADDI
jgi:hypothetical protein